MKKPLNFEPQLIARVDSSSCKARGWKQGRWRYVPEVMSGWLVAGETTRALASGGVGWLNLILRASKANRIAGFGDFDAFDACLAACWLVACLLVVVVVVPKFDTQIFSRVEIVRCRVNRSVENFRIFWREVRSSF
jgi:hypothetical protein